MWWVAADSKAEGREPATVTTDYLTEVKNTRLFLFHSFKPLTKSVSETR